ncbi:hypothetical protein [Streptomyces sp. NPDC023327]|uniref:hypothetical protein n=1 Tax=Streptomyces sp. NPDC023327 TaxID=3157088 RepID=UPI00340455C0
MSEVLNTAVGKGYFAVNPLSGFRWNAPAVNEEVDPAAVPNPAQVSRLLAAVAQQRGRGPHLEAFFGCMYYAAMRPAEVIHLRLEQCRLPGAGWGMLNLSGGVVTAGKEWTDDGAVHEVHSLKRRAATATRPVPIPPQCAHIKRFGVALDGRVFRNQAGNYVDASAYGITWARARKHVLASPELASGLAKRPYDLRHAGISFWLYSGVDPAKCARRAGESIEVLECSSSEDRKVRFVKLRWQSNEIRCRRTQAPTGGLRGRSVTPPMRAVRNVVVVSGATGKAVSGPGQIGRIGVRRTAPAIAW